MRLKLVDNSDLVLSSGLNVGQRICLASEIISDNPDCFSMTGNMETDRRTNIRLDILGAYILNADKEKQKTIMSRYKQKARQFQELPISSFSECLSNKLLTTSC